MEKTTLIIKTQETDCNKTVLTKTASTTHFFQRKLYYKWTRRLRYGKSGSITEQKDSNKSVAGAKSSTRELLALPYEMEGIPIREEFNDDSTVENNSFSREEEEWKIEMKIFFGTI